MKCTRICSQCRQLRVNSCISLSRYCDNRVCRMIIALHSQKAIIFGLCAFMAFLSFKPSEPYLSEYLVCNEDTQQDYCSGFGDVISCNSNVPCSWQEFSGTSYSCSITPCSNVTIGDCGNSDYDYCSKKDHTNAPQTCEETHCYKSFSEDEVNDEIYPWSTYAYLPFLLLLGPLAELFSYRAAILVGICGRLVTRFLLLYGTSILDMQLMQVAYAFGTAAEDVLAAYVFYTLSPAYYQLGTSYIKATALATNVVAGVCGDLLVVEGGVSLRILMWISAVSVCIGFLVGVAVLQPPHSVHHSTGNDGNDGTTNTGIERLVSSVAPQLDKYASDISNGSGGGSGGSTSANDAGVNGVSNPLVFVAASSVHSQARVSDELSSLPDSPHSDTSIISDADRIAPVAAATHGTIGRAATAADKQVCGTAHCNVTPHSVVVPHTSTSMKDKLQMFREQLLLLRLAFRSRTLTALVLYWVVGNAVFSTLYDYEVAVYAELNGGSNAWNGSVLAAMLLAGTVGALLPTWLKHDTYEVSPAGAGGGGGAVGTGGGVDNDCGDSDNAVSAIFVSTPEFVVGMRIIIAGVLSCGNLLLFVLSWQVAASVSFLALYFATWQYINVVVFARIALALKVAQYEQQDLTSKSNASSASNRIDSKNSAEVRARTIVPLGIVPLETVAPRSPASAASVESAAGVASVLILQNPIQHAGSVHSSYAMELGNSDCSHGHDGAKHSSRNSHCAVVDRDASLEHDLTGRQMSQEHTLHTQNSGITESETEPPYSVAIVSIIALNVVVQIILQAITFSGLALSLRTSCWIFVLTFCVATAVYIICLLILFGGERILAGLKKVFA